jgi:predicted nucleic acid-binding protein
MKLKNIYLDVCALSRLFDEQEYLRIRIETEAVNLILSKVRAGAYKMLFSPVHIKEIEAIPDAIERIELRSLLDDAGTLINPKSDETRTRAEELVASGFGVADAAHIAFAEQEGASFITCDDRLIKKCKTFKINVWCGTPVAYCEREGLK